MSVVTSHSTILTTGTPQGCVLSPLSLLMALHWREMFARKNTSSANFVLFQETCKNPLSSCISYWGTVKSILTSCITSWSGCCNVAEGIRFIQHFFVFMENCRKNKARLWRKGLENVASLNECQKDTQIELDTMNQSNSFSVLHMFKFQKYIDLEFGNWCRPDLWLSFKMLQLYETIA